MEFWNKCLHMVWRETIRSIPVHCKNYLQLSFDICFRPLCHACTCFVAQCLAMEDDRLLRFLRQRNVSEEIVQRFVEDNVSAQCNNSMQNRLCCVLLLLVISEYDLWLMFIVRLFCSIHKVNFWCNCNRGSSTDYLLHPVIISSQVHKWNVAYTQFSRESGISILHIYCSERRLTLVDYSCCHRLNLMNLPVGICRIYLCYCLPLGLVGKTSRQFYPVLPWVIG